LRLRGLRSLRSLRFPRWLLGGSLLALLGCASTAEGPLDRAALAKVARAQGLDPAAVVLPYEPTPEMKAWVHEMVPPAITKDDDRLQHLLAALLDPKRLGLTYEAHYTGTAREVFASHRANCLAFTNLFVGLARELGVKVFYLDVDDIEKFEKEGDLVVISGHISTGYGSGRDVRILDFAAAPTVHYRAIRPISDRTAVALYYSNRGGELLRTGSQEEALKWLRTSVALDPELARAWINLGVALRRTGDGAGAEAAYRKALTIDPQAVSAYQNLASLLRLRGSDEAQKEAAELTALVERLGSRNPFDYLNLGDLALGHGRLDEARQLYRKALRLYHQSAEPYAAMGLWAVSAGDLREARKWLRKAAAIDPDNGRVKLLESRLKESGQKAAG